MKDEELYYGFDSEKQKEHEIQINYFHRWQPSNKLILLDTPQLLKKLANGGHI